MKIFNSQLDFPYRVSSANIIVSQGDSNSLFKVMVKNGVDKEDIKELIAIVKSEKPDSEYRQLGENANDWILKVFGKVVNSEGNLNPGLTANSLATSIKQYYGIAD